MGQDLQQAWDRLRSMKDPESRQDVVALGLAKDIKLHNGELTVQLAPPVGDSYRHDALAAAIRRELSAIDEIDKVFVTWDQASSDCNCNCSTAATTSVSLPVLDNGSGPEMDAMNASLGRPGIAPSAGYGEGGPEPLLSPESEIPDERYEGWPPVFQWEIDPADPSLSSGESHVRIGDWEYDIWWQAHPAELIYASIQALSDDTMTSGPERQHPTGRNVVVNMVYDSRRGAVIAVYGTARDFRPFIEAFRKGCDLKRHAKESNE